jgi:ribosomal protein L11
MEFCKRFNEETSKYELGLPLSVVIFKKSDNTFDFVAKLPNFSFLLWTFLGEGTRDSISVLELYDLVRLESLKGVYGIKRFAKMVLGRLSSGKVRITI